MSRHMRYMFTGLNPARALPTKGNMKAEFITLRQRDSERKLLAKLKKLTGWNASQIIREALKQFAVSKGVGQ